MGLAPKTKKIKTPPIMFLGDAGFAKMKIKM